MTGTIKGLLLIEGLDLARLAQDYRLFFLGLLPSMFVLAILIEFLGDLSPFSLLKRAFISILILSSITTFYYSSISASMDAAESMLDESKASNILLMDLFEGGKYLDQLNLTQPGKNNSHDESVIGRAYAFLKYQLFDGFVNDGLTVVIFFITKLCFLILKVVYSLVYYLGIGLIGIPCILYLFPGMGGVMRGAILSFVWCLIIPHVLVFILTIIGSEINKGYAAGGIIGGSIVGTALLFILTLFIAFTPLIAGMILQGSGMAQAGGIIAAMGANYVMNLPRNSINTGASLLMGGPLGPKATIAKKMAKGSYIFAKGFKDKMPGFNMFSAGNGNSGHSPFGSTKNDHPKGLSHAGISGNLPPHTDDSDYVTLKNSNKKSGADFISAPTRKNPIYSSSQFNNDSKNSSPETKTRANTSASRPSRGNVQFPRSPSRMNQENQNSRRNNGTVPESRPSNRTYQAPPYMDRGHRSHHPGRSTRGQYHGGPKRR